MEITQKELDAKPVLAQVFDAFYHHERYRNVLIAGESIHFGTSGETATDLHQYINSRGTSLLEYCDDFFRFGGITA